MLINAELLLQFQRCKRRTFLDTHGDFSQKDVPDDLLRKLQQDKIAHRKSVLANFTYHRPTYLKKDWEAGAKATLELMQQGVECIRQGVLLANYSDIKLQSNELTDTEEDEESIFAEFPISPSLQPSQHEEYTLLSRPDLLLKQPGYSCFGDWMYVPASIELGKRPKQEYQIVAAFHAQILARVQQVEQLDQAWLILRDKDVAYEVDLAKWLPQMQLILEECIQTLESADAPEVFISRQKCNLCHWYSYCYAIAQSEKHLSLLPGVTPIRYTQLQALSLTTLKSLAQASPTELANLPGFDSQVAPKLILQAQSVLENRPLLLPKTANIRPSTYRPNIKNSTIELYFDIEAQPDLHLNYLLGVLVVDKQANTEKFYAFLAEKPEEEELIWQQFLHLVWQYPHAPIFHFCVYELDTVKRLAKLYQTPYSFVSPLLNRFVDVYEELTKTVALPIESYALKAIARWIGFEWRNPEASGAKCIYWYDQWLETGDRTLLEIIQRYNEDDCRATRNVKDWLVNFLRNK